MKRIGKLDIQSLIKLVATAEALIIKQHEEYEKI